MKKIIIIASFLFTMILSIEAKAEFKVPVSNESQQWKIELLEPSKDESFAQGEKGKYEVYSLLMTNKGKEVYNVEVEAFRNEPSEQKMYGLDPRFEKQQMQTGDTFRFRNFAVKAGTEKLELVITWEDEPITLKDGKKAPGRNYKETILFTP